MTAREKLIRVMKRRMWYKDVLPPATARSFKRQVLSGESVTNDKIRDVLMKLGYKPKVEEEW